MFSTHRLSKFSALSLALVAGLILSGCSAGDNGQGQTPPPNSDTSDSANNADANSNNDGNSNSNGNGDSDESFSAVFNVDGREFTFELMNCMGDMNDMFFEGPGFESGSDVPSYLVGDLVSATAGEVGILIDATDSYAKTEDQIRIGIGTDGSVTMVEDGAGYLITGAARDYSGASLGDGSVKVTCFG